MGLKFRLKGLAETFIECIHCPRCNHDGGEEGDQGFKTDHTRVTYDGIVVVIECGVCGEIFVPDGQRFGILNYRRLRTAVQRDSSKTGQPLMGSIKDVRLTVERLNAERNNCLH